jgi:hypothetical protein
LLHSHFHINQANLAVQRIQRISPAPLPHANQNN